MKRQINDLKVEQAKIRTIEAVMNEIETVEEPRKSFFTFKNFSIILAPILLSTLLIGFLFTNPQDPDTPVIPDPNPVPSELTLLDTEESLQVASISYISGSLLAQSFNLSTIDFVASNQYSFLEQLSNLELEDNIEEFNVYFDMLLPFFDEEPLHDIDVIELTDEDYNQQINFTVDSVQYVLYVTLSDNTFEGILEINDLSFDVTGTITSNETDDLEIKLEASNDTGQIEIEYKEEKLTETKYEIKQTLNGETTVKEIKVEKATDEYKIEITENEDSYELKREIENGTTIYKLEYEVAGIKGEATILESIDQLGNPIYIYTVEENGEEKEIHKEKN